MYVHDLLGGAAPNDSDDTKQAADGDRDDIKQAAAYDDCDDDDDSDSLSCYKFMKLWFNDFWAKKKMFLSIVPHLVDQATDFGKIWAYFDAYKQNKASQWFWIMGVLIILSQRIISSATIWFITRNITSTILQMFDLLMIKAIWVNYYFDLKEPGNPQRYISILVKYTQNENICKHK